MGVDEVLYYDVSLDRSPEYDISLPADDTSDYGLQISGEESIAASLDSAVRVKVTSYSSLTDKPKIEGVTLDGNKSFHEIGLNDISAQEIDEIMFGGG